MKNNKTIILESMLGLEWMTENLSGHGGTEINGATYYTWEQAMAAAKELGDGWRLPTKEEFMQLDAAGSMWDIKRKGRWFGGNHSTDHTGSIFLSAAGFLNRETGVATGVGTGGDYWCSSPYSSTSAYAGHLYFGTGGVVPLNGNYRAGGFSVRCVRKSK